MACTINKINSLTAFVLVNQKVKLWFVNKPDFNRFLKLSLTLQALFQDKCVVEGVDSVMMHEIVLGGHLYLQLLKEKLETFLQVLSMLFVCVTDTNPPTPTPPPQK